MVNKPLDFFSQLKHFNPGRDGELWEKKKKFIHFMGQYPDCFYRTCMPGHLTASAFLLNPDKSQALLMHHKKLSLWIQPGGHADGEQQLLQVAIKEAKEESGLTQIIPLSPHIFDLDIHLVPAHAKDPEHLHYDVRFLLQSLDTQVPAGNPESFAVQWFDIQNYQAHHLEPSVNRLFKRYHLISAAQEEALLAD